MRVAIAILPDRAERLNYHVRSGVLALLWQEELVSKFLSLKGAKMKRLIILFIGFALGVEDVPLTVEIRVADPLPDEYHQGGQTKLKKEVRNEVPSSYQNDKVHARVL